MDPNVKYEVGGNPDVSIKVHLLQTCVTWGDVAGAEGGRESGGV